MITLNKIYCGNAVDVLKTFPDNFVNCVVTSPPYYGLRDYKAGGEEIGNEQSPDEYVQRLVEVFREVRRCLCNDGTFWLNIGDSYYNYRPGKGQSQAKQTIAKTKQDNPDVCPKRGNKLVGLKEKDLIGIPWMLAFALRADGWFLRQDIIWNKGNPMPESVKDRCTKSHEYVFLLTKSQKYYFDNEIIREPCSEANVKDFTRRKTMDNQDGGEGTYSDVRPDLYRGREAYMPKDFKKNRRSVWNINTKPYKGAHFATFPEALVEPCIQAGCPLDGVVLDPFSGAGTTAVVAKKLGMSWLGVELNAEYIKLSEKRINLA
jgi:DNA modification methylase